MTIEKLSSPISSNPTAWDSLKNLPFSADQSPHTIPSTSPNRTCNWYLREIENLGHMESLKSFIIDAISRDYKELNSPAELNEFCSAYHSAINPLLNSKAKSTLKHYSGLGYKAINQVARGFWDYDILGHMTPEKLAEAQQDIQNLSLIIASLPPINIDLTAYRGTNLKSFQNYAVTNLTDLKNLENQFYLETGFTSTSLSRDASFIDHKFNDPLRDPCNIEIKYLLPRENNQCIGLFSDDLSYSKQQRELLLNRDSLSYISKVELAPDHQHASLEMLLLPRDIYDPAP